jgi:hypothetical protein
VSVNLPKMRPASVEVKTHYIYLSEFDGREMRHFGIILDISSVARMTTEKGRDFRVS